MNITLNGGKENCCLVFEGAMTRQFSREMEDRIIDCMRRYPNLKVDLSGVSEIDLCGEHLLGVLHSFGDDVIRIVATSPVVETALSRIPKTPVSRRNGSSCKPARASEPAPLPGVKPGAVAL